LQQVAVHRNMEMDVGVDKALSQIGKFKKEKSEGRSCLWRTGKANRRIFRSGSSETGKKPFGKLSGFAVSAGGASFVQV